MFVLYIITLHWINCSLYSPALSKGERPSVLTSNDAPNSNLCLSVWCKSANCMCVDRWSVWWKPEIRHKVLSCARRWTSATLQYAGWTGDHDDTIHKNYTENWKSIVIKRGMTLKHILWHTHTHLWHKTSVTSYQHVEYNLVQLCVYRKAVRL